MSYRGPFNSSRTGQNLSTSGYGLLDYKKHFRIVSDLATSKGKRKYEDTQDVGSGMIVARMPLFKFSSSNTTKEDKDKIWASFTVIEQHDTLREARKAVQFVGVADNEVDVFAHFSKELTAIVAGAITIPNFSEEPMFPGQLITAMPPPVDQNLLKAYKKRLSSQNNNYRDVVPGYFAPLRPVGAWDLLYNSITDFANRIYKSKDLTLKRLNESENPTSKLERHEEVALRLEYLFRMIVGFHMTYATNIGGPYNSIKPINNDSAHYTGDYKGKASAHEETIRTEVKDFMDLFLNTKKLEAFVSFNTDHYAFYADGLQNTAQLISNVLFEDTSRVVGRCIRQGLSGTTDQAHAVIY